MTKELSYCDVRTTQCEDEIVKCEKKIRELSNVTKGLSYVMLELHNVRMKPSNMMCWQPGGVWYGYSNNNFHCLNNTIRISTTLFHLNVFPKKIKQYYQNNITKQAPGIANSLLMGIVVKKKKKGM